MTVWTSVAAVKAEILDRLRGVPDVSRHLLDGSPETREDLNGPTGEGVAVWLDNELVVQTSPIALGVGKIRESYELGVIVQALPADSGVTAAQADDTVATIVSAINGEMLYGTGRLVAIPLDGWTVRCAPTGQNEWRCGPHDNAKGGYAASCRIGLQIDADRC